MQTLTAFLVDEHIKDLQRSARSARLGRSIGRGPLVPAWRRVAGGAVRRAGAALQGVAEQLDRHPGRASYGRE